MRSSLKADPTPIIRAHWRTFVDARDGSPRRRDYVVFLAPPLAVFIVCCWREVELGGAISVGLLTITGLVGAFLFSVMLQVAGSAMGWADSLPEKGPATSAHARLLEELSANAGYASLVAIAASASFAVAGATNAAWVDVVSTALGLALATHLVLVLLMVMKRVFAVTQERLIRARTGADRVVQQDGPRRVASK